MTKQYKLPPLMRGVELGLTGFSMLGAVIMSQGLWEGYWAMLAANLCGVTLFAYTRWWPSFTRNAVFLIATCVGIYNTIL